MRWCSISFLTGFHAAGNPFLISPAGLVPSDAASGVLQQAVVAASAAVVMPLAEKDLLSRTDKPDAAPPHHESLPPQRPQEQFQEGIFRRHDAGFVPLQQFFRKAPGTMPHLPGALRRRADPQQKPQPPEKPGQKRRRFPGAVRDAVEPRFGAKGFRPSGSGAPGTRLYTVMIKGRSSCRQRTYSSAREYTAARPARRTRSPSTRQYTTPPRGDA